MKTFLVSVCVAIIMAVIASVALTQGVQENAKTAFTSHDARP